VYGGAARAIHRRVRHVIPFGRARIAADRAMKNLLREPLVHFLALGALLFALFAWKGGGAAAGSERVVVRAAQVDQLAAGFARTWQRRPTDAELKGLVDDFVRDEVAAREAVALGLDKDDEVVRRRLRQKLELLSEDEGAPAPTDAELEAWLGAHPNTFAQEPRLAFRQVLLSATKRGAAAREDAEALLARLKGKPASADAAGDASLLPAEQPSASVSEVGRVFGEDFARAAMALEPGAWAGPIASPFGFHVVFVKRRDVPAAPGLADIRPLVEREVLAERKKRRLDAMYAKLLAKYDVKVEGGKR
jgi:hypothetical protein